MSHVGRCVPGAHKLLIGRVGGPARREEKERDMRKSISKLMASRRQAIALGVGGAVTLALGACSGGGTDGSTTTEETPAPVTPGAIVAADEVSPTGYTVTFAFDGTGSEKAIESVSVTGPFRHIDPALDLMDEKNDFAPQDYVAGQYASNYIPSAGMEKGWGYTEEMTDEDGDGVYTVSFPLASGSYAYSYLVKYEGEDEPVTIEDPANPSPASLNPNSITPTGDITHSIVYGAYDADRQGDTPNLDFVLPATGDVGTLEYVSYEGMDGVTQYLGVYVPTGYDANAADPYKVIYMSHGGGGNETDWFAMGHVDNIMDNALAAGEATEALIVTMDNSHYEWDFAKIEENVLKHIIPFVEATYNVSTDAADRAFCGLSMGCMTTMHMYFDHPTEFAYLGMWSAADMDAVKDTEGLDYPTVMAAVGTCDIASEKIMPNDDEQQKKYEDFERWVATQDLPNIHCDGYVLGSHDWFTWSQCFHTFVTEYLWK